MCGLLFFFFKQKTAYEMRISDWSSDVCSSDLTQTTAASSARPLSLASPTISSAVPPVTQPPQVKPTITVARTQPAQDQNQTAFDGLYSQIGRASCRERVCQYV